MLKTVRSAVKLHENALSFTVAEGIVRFEEITGNVDGGRAFFATTYLTEGLTDLLKRATKRLAGKSDDVSFHLKQAMGGGKTHSITALSFLARHPELRNEVLPDVPEARQFNTVRFAAFNGRETPENFFWGVLAGQLGATELLDKDVTKAPDEKVWTKIFNKSSDPVLIVLDELPPYFQELATYPMGNGTLADRAARAFGNMLATAHKHSNVCIVVSNLDGAFQLGAQVIARALRDAQSELKRQEVSITPVDLDSDETYEILRKRFMREMPDPNVIDAVAEAYARALEAAGQANLIDKGAEQVAREIRNTYPFHPRTKHLFALFKDNLEFRQTRGLMELSSLLLKSVWESEEDVYLVGPQHFDLSMRTVSEKLESISRLGAAIASDIHEDAGGAVAQVIDNDLGNKAASEAAALLLTSSLSTTGDANRGLRVRDALAILINPHGGEEDYTTAMDRLYDRASYMHKTPEDRLYFDRQVNLNVLLNQNAVNAPENRVNEIISRRIKDLFEPTEKTAYAELIDGTDGIDLIIERIRQKRVLVAVRPDGHLPPEEVERLFHSLTEKNNLFILTGERSFEASKLTDAARTLYATRAAQRDVKSDNPQYEELMERDQAADTNLTHAIIGTFDRILVPIQIGSEPPKLRAIPIQLNPGSSDGSGEAVITQALQKQPRKLFTDVTGNDFDAIRAKVEGLLWGTQEVAMYSDVERRARETPSAYWLPPRGMQTLRDTAVQRDIWEDLGNGRISKTLLPKTPTVQISLSKEPTATNDEAILDVTPVNASDQAVMHYAENRAATTDDPRVTGGKITTKAVSIGILIIDPTRDDTPEAPNHSQQRWDHPLPIAHRVHVDPNTQERTIELFAHHDASVTYTLDGTNPRSNGIKYDGEAFKHGAERATLLVLVTYTTEGAITFENSESFTIPEQRHAGTVDPWEALDAGKPTTLMHDTGVHTINERANVFKALEVIRDGDIHLLQADLIVQSGNGVNGQFHVRTTGDHASLTASTIRALLDGAFTTLGSDEGTITLRFKKAAGSNYTYLKNLADLLQTPVTAGQVQQ